MKTKRLNLIFRELTFFILLFITFNAHSSVLDTTITRSTTLDMNDVVYIHSSSFDTDIQTWDKNELKVDYKLVIEAETIKEKNEFLKIFISSIDENINKSKKITDPFSQINRSNEKVLIKFEKSNQKYQLKELKGTLTIRMPKHNALNASTTFHSLTVDNLDSDATIDVSSAKLKMGSCKKLELHSNFSRNMMIGDVEQAMVTINSSDLKMGAIRTDLTMKGNFSDVEISKIGNSATIDINSSSFKTTDIKNLDLKGNFIRSFVVQNVEKASLNINSTDFKAGKINLFEIGKTSFSTFRIDEVGTMNIGNSSSSKFYIEHLNSLDAAQCNFSNFDIDVLTGRLIIKSSSGSININQVTAGFNEIRIDGQFVTTNIHVDEDSNYKIAADLQFPKYNFSNITYEDHQKDMSHEIMNGWHGNKGKATSKIGFTCQSCNIKLE